MSLQPGFTMDRDRPYISTKRLLHSTNCCEASNITRPCDMLLMAVANNVLRRLRPPKQDGGPETGQNADGGGNQENPAGGPGGEAG